MTAIYIGVMTGTSMDGVDIVAASFDPLQLHATLTLAFDPDLRDELMALTLPDDNEIDRMGKADVALAQMIGHGINALIEKNNLDKSRIKAIGSHGQTIRHRPEHGFTLQIGDPNIITEITQIPVISDFRRRDLAAGGQGAPLVPAFHQDIFQHDSIHRVILNLGGIANVSLLPAGKPEEVYGFDTGPANILMDAWCSRYTGQPFDENGNWQHMAPRFAVYSIACSHTNSSPKNLRKVPVVKISTWNGWMNRLLTGAMTCNTMNWKILQKMYRRLY